MRAVAISVDAPAVSQDLAHKAGYRFTILSDPDTTVILRYHLLHIAGGPEGHGIARPAEFLIDRAKIDRWDNFTEDVRVRADEMLAGAG